MRIQINLQSDQSNFFRLKVLRIYDDRQIRPEDHRLESRGLPIASEDKR